MKSKKLDNIYENSLNSKIIHSINYITYLEGNEFIDG